MFIDAMAIGTDLEEVGRFNRPADDPLFHRCYSEQERAYCLGKDFPAPHFAVRFCAKEAGVKALCGLGRKGVLLTDFEVMRSLDGVPYLTYRPALGTLVLFHLSLSHTEAYATATVLAIATGPL